MHLTASTPSTASWRRDSILKRCSCRSAVSAIVFVAFLAAAWPAPAVLGDVDATASRARAMNVGKAQLENGDYAEAAATFRAALESRPRDGVALRNLARALFFAGDYEGALAALEDKEAAEAAGASAQYLRGLAHLEAKRPERALEPLEEAARLDPYTAAIRFQLAKVYEAVGRVDDAFGQYEAAARLDPQHAAARFSLAMYARKRGDVERYREELRDYKRLRDAFGDPETSPLALQACRHTLAEAPPSLSAGEASVASTPVRFVDVTDEVFSSEAATEVVALAALDAFPDGRYSLAVLEAGGVLTVYETALGERLRPTAVRFDVGSFGWGTKIRVGHFRDVVSAETRLDADRPLFAGVALLGDSRAALLARSEASAFVDVTEEAGLSDSTARDACWVDYEGDSDLDLLLATDDGVRLWQNSGEGVFVEVSRQASLSGEGGASAVATADLDGNGAPDIVAVEAELGTSLFENQRAGQFRPLPPPAGPRPSANGIAIDDLDNDGFPDVVLSGADRTVVKSRGQLGLQAIEHPGFAVTASVLTDFDNDGWVDYCAAGEASNGPGQSVLRVWRNVAGTHWDQATERLGASELRSARVGELVAIDLDADGDDELLAVGDGGGVTVLRNDGGNSNRQLKLILTSRAMANHGGIGSTIEVRSGSARFSRLVTREHGTTIGLGKHEQIDTVQVVWPDGTVDNEIGVSEDVDVVSVERKSSVITGSCPYLYAWDGSEFRFITDFLGSGALGLALTREAVWPPDPVQLVRIGSSSEFRPRDGRYSIVVGSELREVDYFDSLRLVAVDHLPAFKPHPTDSFMPPPVTPSELWTVGHPVPLLAAVDTLGRDVTEALQATDRSFALPGPVLPPPFRGVCRPISYTLEFATIPDGPLALAVSAHLEFGTASSNIALSQSPSHNLIWPTLEAETVEGDWVNVPVNIGIPDGRTKSHVGDLTGKLPEGSRRLRLTTSFEVYWDRIALMQIVERPSARVHEREFTVADLAWRGFSRMEENANGVGRAPIFAETSDKPEWRTTLEGWCTRYGDARELIAQTDGKLAVLNGGDALSLECPESAFPPVPDGYERTFFLSAVGWDKEENANTVGGDKVGPLPGQSEAEAQESSVERDDWIQRYNTRWVDRVVY